MAPAAAQLLPWFPIALAPLALLWLLLRLRLRLGGLGVADPQRRDEEAEQGPLRPIVSESNTLDGAINNLNEIFGQQYAQAESLTALSLENQHD